MPSLSKFCKAISLWSVFSIQSMCTKRQDQYFNDFREEKKLTFYMFSLITNVHKSSSSCVLKTFNLILHVLGVCAGCTERSTVFKLNFVRHWMKTVGGKPFSFFFLNFTFSNSHMVPYYRKPRPPTNYMM